MYPLSKVMLRATESRSAAPMKPSSGEKNPYAMLTHSRAIWSRTGIRGKVGYAVKVARLQWGNPLDQRSAMG